MKVEVLSIFNLDYTLIIFSYKNKFTLRCEKRKIEILS